MYVDGFGHFHTLAADRDKDIAVMDVEIGNVEGETPEDISGPILHPITKDFVAPEPAPPGAPGALPTGPKVLAPPTALPTLGSLAVQVNPVPLAVTFKTSAIPTALKPTVARPAKISTPSAELARHNSKFAPAARAVAATVRLCGAKGHQHIYIPDYGYTCGHNHPHTTHTD